MSGLRTTPVSASPRTRRLSEQRVREALRQTRDSARKALGMRGDRTPRNNDRGARP